MKNQVKELLRATDEEIKNEMAKFALIRQYVDAFAQEFAQSEEGKSFG